jgi:hypothetical protein
LLLPFGKKGGLGYGLLAGVLLLWLSVVVPCDRIVEYSAFKNPASSAHSRVFTLLPSSGGRWSEGLTFVKLLMVFAI